MKKTFQALLICVIILFISPPIAVRASLPVNKKVICIDPGHGEWDPGKQNRSVDEKNINLAVAKKLQSLLELGGAMVFTTRSDDTALADGKREDLSRRAFTANAAGADIYLSIHQNSHSSTGVNGAQVFYHASSEASKALAESIQKRLNEFVGRHDGTPGKKLATASESYFVLKKTGMPAVIIECGFMSNLKDLELLQSEDFQEKIAWAIYTGVMDYFAAKSENTPN